MPPSERVASGLLDGVVGSALATGEFQRRPKRVTWGVLRFVDPSPDPLEPRRQRHPHDRWRSPAGSAVAASNGRATMKSRTRSRPVRIATLAKNQTRRLCAGLATDTEGIEMIEGDIILRGGKRAKVGIALSNVMHGMPTKEKIDE